jgi:hypothetical protein
MAVSAAGTLGWVNEFIIVGRIHQAQGLTLAILGVLCWLIYAVLALLPCLVLEEALRARRAKGTSR